MPRPYDTQLKWVGVSACARAAARPALVRERHGQLCLEPLRTKRLLRFAVELALNDHVDQPRAKTGSSAALGGGASAFFPVQHQGQSLLSPDHRPFQIDAPCRLAQAAVLAR